MGAGIHVLVEETLKEMCSYCRQPHETEFIREYHLNFAYLVGECTECGHTLRIRDD